jgi:hypothetical protein
VFLSITLHRSLTVTPTGEKGSLSSSTIGERAHELFHQRISSYIVVIRALQQADQHRRAVILPLHVFSRC